MLEECRAFTRDIYQSEIVDCPTLLRVLPLVGCLDNQGQGRYGTCPCNQRTMPTRAGQAAYRDGQKKSAWGWSIPTQDKGKGK